MPTGSTNFFQEFGFSSFFLKKQIKNMFLIFKARLRNVLKAVNDFTGTYIGCVIANVDLTASQNSKGQPVLFPHVPK
jgi:hypothetical protein